MRMIFSSTSRASASRKIRIRAFRAAAALDMSFSPIRRSGIAQGCASSACHSTVYDCGHGGAGSLYSSPMDFKWDDEQRTFRAAVREFLAAHLPKDWESLAHGPGTEWQ